MSDGLPIPKPAGPQLQPRIEPMNQYISPLMAGGSYLAFWQIVTRIHASGIGVVVLSTVISLCLLIWFVGSLARSLRTLRITLVHTAVLAVLVIPLRALLATHSGLAMTVAHTLPGISDLLFLWFAAATGVLLSYLVRSINLIPPIAAVLALVDIWTVLLGGPVSRIMESKSAAAVAVTSAMTFQLPTPTAGASPMAFSQVIGFADALFIAFFVAAICRFVPTKDIYQRTIRALCIVLGLYMVATLLPSYEVRLPALPPMALAVLALNWRQFKYTRAEIFAMLYALALVIAIVTGFWFLGR